jgi:hypothetical protein
MNFQGATVQVSLSLKTIILTMAVYVQCTIGWVDFGLFFTFSTKVGTPEIYYISSKSTENSKNFFDPVNASSLVTTFWVMHYRYIRVHNMDFMSI